LWPAELQQALSILHERRSNGARKNTGFGATLALQSGLSLHEILTLSRVTFVDVLLHFFALLTAIYVVE
jgi:hypothetical protein